MVFSFMVLEEATVCRISLHVEFKMVVALLILTDELKTKLEEANAPQNLDVQLKFWELDRTVLLLTVSWT